MIRPPVIWFINIVKVNLTSLTNTCNSFHKSFTNFCVVWFGNVDKRVVPYWLRDKVRWSEIDPTKCAFFIFFAWEIKSFSIFFFNCQSVLYLKERGIKFLFQYHTSNVCMVSQRMLPVALSFLSHDLSAVDFDAFALLKEGAAYNDYLGELRLLLKNPQAGIPSWNKYGSCCFEDTKVLSFSQLSGGEWHYWRTRSHTTIIILHPNLIKASEFVMSAFWNIGFFLVSAYFSFLLFSGSSCRLIFCCSFLLMEVSSVLLVECSSPIFSAFVSSSSSTLWYYHKYGNGKMARFRYFGDDDSNDETKRQGKDDKDKDDNDGNSDKDYND